MARTVVIDRMGIQNETSDKFYVVWHFPTTYSAPSTSVSTSVRVGSVVSVKRGSTWYNGASIPSFVYSKQWKVIEVRGDRAVLGRSTDGVYNIISPIRVSNLTGGTTTTTTSSPVSQGGYETVDHYELKWWYDSGNGDWFEDGTETTTHLAAVHTIPSNATRMRFTITPVAKKYGDKNTPYWQGAPVQRDWNVLESKPQTLSAPTVKMDKFKLSARYDNISDARTDKIEFEVYKTGVNNYATTTRFTVGEVTVVQARAEFVTNIEAGYKYSVRARAVNLISTGKNYGEWSPYSSEESTIPGTPVNVQVFADSKTSVALTWDEVNTATEYTVEYTSDKKYFDTSSQVQSMTVKVNKAYITGLEKGKEWYFRVLAKNEKGQSGYSDIVYKIVGTKPEAPTTWTLTATAIVGEEITLYWTHNTEDGSKQNEAQIELVVNGVADILTIDTTADATNENVTADKVYSYVIPVEKYSDGAQILWRVRTRGITFEYSDWSIQRTIDVYAPPVATMKLGDNSAVLSHFPFDIAIQAGPSNQTVLSYHISIVAESAYSTLNQNGETEYVNPGTEIFSKVILTKENTFTYTLLPSDIILENNQSYTVIVTAAMNSGLNATATGMFLVSWAESIYDTDASISIDDERLCAYITPKAYNADGEMPADAVLSIYRREYDGSFTEIARDIPNTGNTSATDPHPSLDYARYRVVVRNTTTGVINFSDIPGVYIGEPSIVIQWDEEWKSFDVASGYGNRINAWSGSMLKLPYNVDTSENYDLDKSLVEYIGRKNPVSYFGTQKGVTASWSTDIPKDDKETLYALRRLAAYDGNVYVREPNGTGYLAIVTPSWSIKHREVTIPVSFSVSKVEV